MSDEFQRGLDTAILSGLSSAKVARMIGVAETTVRRRKRALAESGHNFIPFAQRTQREDNHVNHNRD
jgi:transposase